MQYTRSFVLAALIAVAPAGWSVAEAPVLTVEAAAPVVASGPAARQSAAARHAALELRLRASGNADVEAAFDLAQLLVSGEDGMIDTARAIELLRAAFDSGSPEAGAELGNLLLHQIGHESEALEILQRAFQQGAGRAGFLIADQLAYQDLSSSMAVNDIAETLLRAAVQRGDLASALTLADRLREIGTSASSRDARELYGLATSNGSASAPFWAATLDETTTGPTAASEALYDLAARRGYLAAARELARRSNEVGSPDQLKRRLFWQKVLIDAADPVASLDRIVGADLSDAQRRDIADQLFTRLTSTPGIALGDIVAVAKRFAAGDGVPRDDEHALALFMLAAGKGSEVAATNLVSLAETDFLDEGKSGAARQVLDIVQTLADNGSQVGALALGDLLLRGIGTDTDARLAAAWYEKVAGAESASAMLRLAEAYLLTPDGTSQERALPWLRSAADRGSSTAALLLARLYSIAGTAADNTTSAIGWYTRALDAGELSAARPLAQTYLNGDGLDAATSVFTSRLGRAEPRLKLEYARFLASAGKSDDAIAVLSDGFSGNDLTAALERYRIEHQGGTENPASLATLRDALATPSTPDSLKVAIAEALLWSGQASDVAVGLTALTSLFERQVPTSAVALSRAYSEGLGVTRDVSTALATLEAGADRHELDAIIELAATYAAGSLTAPNPERARTLFEAVLRGDPLSPDANLGLGNLLNNGTLGEPDHAAAAARFRTAALGGNAEAALALAQLYEWGRGVDRNGQVAEALYKAASLSGITSGHSALASLYSSGVALTPEPDAAFTAELMAASAGDSVAMIRVARNYLDGYGTAPDMGAGVMWLEKAAANGSTDAMLTLYMAYADGTNVKADPTKADFWLFKAANSGSDRAMYRIAIRSRKPDGTIDDPVAMAWLQKAAALNNNQSKKILHKMGIPLPRIVDGEDE